MTYGPMPSAAKTVAGSVGDAVGVAYPVGPAVGVADGVGLAVALGPAVGLVSAFRPLQPPANSAATAMTAIAVAARGR